MSRAYFRKNGNAREWVRTGPSLAPAPDLDARTIAYAIACIIFALWLLLG